MHDRKILDFLEQAVRRYTDVKDSASESSKEIKEHGRESLYCLREYLNHHK